MEIDSHSIPPFASASDGQQRELFVVQRCWYSGPHQYQPLDLMRLFVSQRDAEEAAYHSAHAWCRYHRPDAEPHVKTLLLPRYPSHSGSSYGFIAHGSLFWVRSLYARTTATTDTSDPQTLTASEGYAVVTEGVIGGTGNRMSRRGTEIPEGRVFLPESGTRTMMMMLPVNNFAACEVMRRKALETCHHVMAQLGTHISTNVATLPIGRPSEYSSGNFLKDWPPQVLHPNLLFDPHSNEHKREAPPPSILSVGSIRTVSTYDEDDDVGIVVDCPFEIPAAKRRRFCDDDVHSFQPSNFSFSGDEVMMSCGLAGDHA